MKVELTVKQRLSIQSILPKQGNYTTVKLLQELKEELSFSEKEHEILKFKFQNDGTVTWDVKIAAKHLKKIHIPEVVLSEIKKTLETLEKSKRLEEQHIDFYELFVMNDEEKVEEKVE